MPSGKPHGLPIFNYESRYSCHEQIDLTRYFAAVSPILVRFTRDSVTPLPPATNKSLG
jgi:hypothetical protein